MSTKPKSKLPAQLWLELPTADLFPRAAAGIKAMLELEVFEGVVILTNESQAKAVCQQITDHVRIVVGGIKNQAHWMQRGSLIAPWGSVLPNGESACILDCESLFNPAPDREPSKWNIPEWCAATARRLADNLPHGVTYLWSPVPGPTGSLDRDAARKHAIWNVVAAFRASGHSIRLISAKYARPDGAWTWGESLDAASEVAGIWSYHTADGVLQPGYWKPSEIPGVVAKALADDTIHSVLVYTGFGGCTPEVAKQIRGAMDESEPPAKADEA